MAWQYTAAAWEHPGLPPHLKLTLLAVAWHANEDGEAWPGQQRLARWCGVGVRQLRSNLQQLADRGLLDVVQRGRNTTNLYRVRLPPHGRQWAAGPSGSGLPDRGGSGLPGNYRKEHLNGGLSPIQDPARCGHLPVDDEGYCTACRTHEHERSASA